ncbi:MAG: hypothetical protein B6242_09310 [Anaerolineaceae bacterium 4572_78]|nr:MAG: hypothetical protein B6242_09310 [Anaerolineaceae bacterium 4572_78]
MKIITNEPFIAKRKKIANILMPLALLFLGGGFFLNLYTLQTPQREVNPMYFYIIMGSLIVGLMLSSISSGLINRWVKEPRADQVLTTVLKGFSKKFTLFNYVIRPPHIMVGQNKIFVVICKPQNGEVSVTNNKWKWKFSFWRLLRFFAIEPLGNPTYEAKSHVQELVNFLREHFTEEELSPMIIEPVIVFTDASITLTVNDSDIPALTGKELKQFIRQSGKEKSGNGNKYVKVVKLLTDTVKQANQ